MRKRDIVLMSLVLIVICMFGYLLNANQDALKTNAEVENTLTAYPLIVIKTTDQIEAQKAFQKSLKATTEKMKGSFEERQVARKELNALMRTADEKQQAQIMAAFTKTDNAKRAADKEYVAKKTKLEHFLKRQ